MFILTTLLLSAPPVLLLPSFTYCINVSVHFTMVTPGNVLVPLIWHFILLHHPLPFAFPSRHTGITLIMIIAVMVMITAAKLRCLAHIQHPGDYDWLKGCWQMFLPSHFFLLSSISLCFSLSCFFVVFGFLYFCSLSTDLSLPPQLTFCLFSVFFNFLPVFHLCSYALFNLSWSLLPPPLVSSSLFFFFFSPYLFSSPLQPAYSSATEEQD